MHTLKAVCLLSAALLLACTQPPVHDESLPLDERLALLGYRQGEPADSILHYDIDGWEYLDPHHIVLGHGPGRVYLVEFNNPCRNLVFGSPLGYSATLGSLTKLDKITTTDAGGFPEHCLIPRYPSAGAGGEGGGLRVCSQSLVGCAVRTRGPGTDLWCARRTLR